MSSNGPLAFRRVSTKSTFIPKFISSNSRTSHWLDEMNFGINDNGFHFPSASSGTSDLDSAFNLLL